MNKSYKVVLVAAVVICAAVIIYAGKKNDPPPAPAATVDIRSIGDEEPTTAPQPLPARDAEHPQAAKAPDHLQPHDPLPDAPTKIEPGVLTLGAAPPSLSVVTTPPLYVELMMTEELRGHAAAPPAPTTALPRRPATKPATYTIRSGDTFTTIAVKRYGSARHWQAIAAANPTVDPTRLQVGQVIKLAAQISFEVDESIPPPPAGTKTHVVATGESLSGIAKQYYKNTAHWRIIYNRNRQTIGSNPNRLQVGDRLSIPPPIVTGRTTTAQ